MGAIRCDPPLTLPGHPSELFARDLVRTQRYVLSQISTASTLDVLLARLVRSCENFLGSLYLEGRALLATGLISARELRKATAQEIVDLVADAVDGLQLAYKRGWLGNLLGPEDEKP